MKNRLFILLFLTLVSCHRANESFELQNGDLLFSVGADNNEFLSAIQQSTSVGDEIPFSHVGIVLVEKEKIYVIEATSPEGVIKSQLDDFFGRAALHRGERLIAVGRLHPEWQYTIPTALVRAKKHLGKNYDYLYNELNDAFYCSELVRNIFTDSTGTPLFEALAMSFNYKATGEVIPYWSEHFRQRNSSIPEGQPGTNPADMARSEKISLVHRYFSLPSQ